MYKIFERPLSRPLALINKNADRWVRSLQTKYKKEKSKFGVEYAWDAERCALLLRSPKYGVSGVIRFEEKKVSGYISLPFLLKPLAALYRDSISREVQAEIDIFLKSLK
jgi:hypothetical protein